MKVVKFKLLELNGSPTSIERSVAVLIFEKELFVNTKSFATAKSPTALNSTVSLNVTPLLNTDPVESTVNRLLTFRDCALSVTNVPLAAEIFPLKLAPVKKVNTPPKGFEKVDVAVVVKKPKAAETFPLIVVAPRDEDPAEK